VFLFACIRGKQKARLAVRPHNSKVGAFAVMVDRSYDEQKDWTAWDIPDNGCILE
jgi:hypothetical protein